MADKALPTGSLVLVTGANGYIGSHVADVLLRLGYHVRAVARDQKKLGPVLATLRQRNPNAKVEGAIVPDIAAENALHDAVEGCAGVIHVASDVSFSPDPNITINSTVNGLQNALEAAASASSVERFVYTSSVVAATRFKPNTKFYWDEHSWNDEDTKAAWAPPPYEEDRFFAVYSESKAASERMAWDFMKSEKVNFVFNSVLPNFTIGPILHPTQSASTGGWINQLAKGEEPGTKLISATLPPQYHINVEDCAKIHVAALLESDVQGERLIASAKPFNYADIVRILQKFFPESKTVYPPANNDRDLSTVGNERAEELLKRYGGRGFVDLEETLKKQFGL